MTDPRQRLRSGRFAPQLPARAKVWAVAALALAATALLLLLPVPGVHEIGWRGQLLDLAHVPLFAGLTVALWPVCGRRWWPPALLALTLAALAEVVQPLVGRSGDLGDFLRGAAGTLAAAALLRAADGPRPSRAGGETPVNPWPRLAAHALAALALVTAPFLEAGPTLVDAAEGFADFPVLADFAAPRRLGRWDCVQTELRRVERPERMPTFAGRVEFRPGPHPHPSVTLRHVSRDFHGYRRLCWSFTVEGGPLTLIFSLRGGPQDGEEGEPTSHYQFSQTFPPGDHVARMDLFDAALLARPHRLDLGDLWWSQLFVPRPAAPRVILLWRVWVE